MTPDTTEEKLECKVWFDGRREHGLCHLIRFQRDRMQFWFGRVELLVEPPVPDFIGRDVQIDLQDGRTGLVRWVRDGAAWDRLSFNLCFDFVGLNGFTMSPRRTIW